MVKIHRPALFLDRDGVINYDDGYVCTPNRFRFMEEIAPIIDAAQSAEYLVIIITNQAGIARGYYSLADYLEFQSWILTFLSSRGLRVDSVYFCPYHPEEGVGNYKRKSFFRKPSPGMILQARDEFDISLEDSILIGDQPTDIQAGVSAGVGYTFKVSNREPRGSLLQIKRDLDVIFFSGNRSALKGEL